MHDFRRNDYDVTNSVQVSSTAAVTAAVRELFAAGWPGESFDRVAVAFEEFERLFSGRMPGYHGVDTVYHDRQHSLDMTLAMARLLVGYEGASMRISASAPSARSWRWSRRCFTTPATSANSMTVQHRNGAEFTLYHVTRSARFLARFLPSIGMENWVPVSTRIVHFTGLRNPTRSRFICSDARDRKLGHLLGTADLIAQMADRCYLEKCRDRLYPEFVLGGIAAAPGSDGALKVRYSSGLDLLRQTPRFVRETRSQRLDGEFEHAYRYLEPLFGGKNPYLEAIDRNVGYLQTRSARRTLALAAAKSAVVHFREQPAGSGARVDGDAIEGALGVSSRRGGPFTQGQSMLAT